jgi:CubicO group peptidase (beta-lactamase class C family)
MYLAVLVTLCAGAQTESIDSKNIDKSIVEILEGAGIPGFSLAIIEGGETTFVQTYGVKLEKSNELVDRKTIFEAASLTKPIVAYCAMKLVGQKRLNLDSPLYKYLEYTPASHDFRYKTITARMVLSHTSGFPNWRSDRSKDTLNIRFEPGTKFGYSGEGFVYLQKVIEKMQGTDLNSIAKRYVFEPLEMTRSSLVLMDDENYAIGHDSASKPKKKSKPQTPNAAYSLHTTADDYAKFINELYTPRFLSVALRDQMIGVQSNMDEQDASLNWGLGVGLNVLEDQTYIWHWGDNGVFRAFFIASVQSGIGFVYFANSENGLSVVNRLIELVYSDKKVMSTWNEYEQY